jgi:hypothetical protein
MAAEPTTPTARHIGPASVSTSAAATWGGHREWRDRPPAGGFGGGNPPVGLGGGGLGGGKHGGGHHKPKP